MSFCWEAYWIEQPGFAQSRLGGIGFPVIGIRSNHNAINNTRATPEKAAVQVGVQILLLYFSSVLVLTVFSYGYYRISVYGLYIDLEMTMTLYFRIFKF